jgi:hypothetical protein
MQLHEFENQMRRLKIIYGEKTFPEEREKMMFKRYNRVHASAFTLGVDWIALKMPNPSAIINELDEKLKDARGREPQADDKRETVYNCEPCRDFGYGWIGDTITRCTCASGRKVSDDEIAKHQNNYDVGRRFLPREKLAAMIASANSRRGA